MISLKSLIKEVMSDQDIKYAQYKANVPAADIEHRKTLAATGFWGKRGAGALILAKSTGRLLIPYRSAKVQQPHTWGAWGGAIDDGDDPAETVRKEVGEEAGYSGQILKLIPLYVFRDQKSGFEYHNFLAVVPDEFEPEMVKNLSSWETEDWKWVEFGDWPSPLHFGMKALIQHSGKDIQKIIQNL